MPNSDIIPILVFGNYINYENGVTITDLKILYS